MRFPDDFRPLNTTALAAATMPALLAFNVSPSPTLLNQVLAFFTWGMFALTVARDARLPAPGRSDFGAAAAPLAALAIVALCAAGSSMFGGLPASLGLSGVGTVLAAMVLVIAGVMMSRGAAAGPAFAAVCWAWVFAGVLNAGIAAVQVFAPSWPDGDWIARSAIAGRAVGNLRQPNHLSSLLIWAAMALVGLLELRRIRLRTASCVMLVIVFAVVLTASRTGVIGVLLLGAWAAIDVRLARNTRRLLAVTPVAYLAGWAFMSTWARLTQATFGGQQRLAEQDLSASRLAIWSDTVALIRDNPWMGVGFGEFNFAWSLSVLPHRPTAFFDHSHNLVLQLAVELGLPLAALVIALLLVALWRGVARARRMDGEASLATRCAVAMLVLIGVHSLLEYPLWYSYFLLPAALALGLAVGGDTAPPAEKRGSPSRFGLSLAACALMVGALGAVADYQRVVAIFSSDEGAHPLHDRIERGRGSLLFAHHADYAAATVSADPQRELAAFARAAHFLVDTRLLMGWAQAYAGAGDLERATYLAQRLREFRNPQSAAFLAECAATEHREAAARPFQCRQPALGLDWRDFRLAD
jgi:O-antigen ligase